MHNRSLALRCLEVHNVSRVTPAVALDFDWLKRPIASGQLVFANAFVVRPTVAHFGVIRRTATIKDADVLVLAEWLLFCVQKICRLGFHPDNFVSEQPGL